MEQLDTKSLEEKMTQIESLLILQLLRDGVTPEQIEIVLKIKKIFPSNIRASFPIKKLKKNNE